MTVLSVSVVGPESVSYERSRLKNWTNLRHCSARVFFVKIPQSQYFSISKFPGYQNGSFSSISRFPGSQVIKMTRLTCFCCLQTTINFKMSISTISTHPNFKMSKHEKYIEIPVAVVSRGSSNKYPSYRLLRLRGKCKTPNS